MTRVGVVGAGAAAAALTYVVDGASAATVTVLEKSGGVCGRAATRRHGASTYDYGANYLQSDDERVNRLVEEVLGTDGLVDVTDPVYTFDCEGTVSPGRDADEHKWSYVEGLTQVGERLFDATDASVHHHTRAETVERADGTWTVVDTDGERWGPFDVLVLNPPAPQTADLLRTAAWDDDRRETLVDAVADVDYRSVWTAVLRYDFELDRPYYALVNTDKEHDVGWVAREECKPGHVPDGESLLVVQSNHEWATERFDEAPERNVATLAAATADVVGDARLTEPVWTDHQGWRYALPEAGVPGGPLQRAQEAGLYCVGDWVAGEGRLHAALRCGLDVGERLTYAL
ncbi:NAD(P)/FAD-dependent oxidoreductase [Salinigranum sp.]|uniref:NAD(P)/FAD-dependent oxidoreductase n=1 Tax=Salinigranum sp. TaxID=1966351 RepID=UPI0035699348